VSQLEVLGKKVDEEVVGKYLCVAPKCFEHVATSIETLLDLSTLTI